MQPCVKTAFVSLLNGFLEYVDYSSFLLGFFPLYYEFVQKNEIIKK